MGRKGFISVYNSIPQSVVKEVYNVKEQKLKQKPQRSAAYWLAQSDFLSTQDHPSIGGTATAGWSRPHQSSSRKCKAVLPTGGPGRGIFAIEVHSSTPYILSNLGLYISYFFLVLLEYLVKTT